MPKVNAKRAVPLDVVPERRTKRCSPRFRSGDRFCELSFRYLSPGSEGKKCRPLDHIFLKKKKTLYSNSEKLTPYLQISSLRIIQTSKQTQIITIQYKKNK